MVVLGRREVGKEAAKEKKELGREVNWEEQKWLERDGNGTRAASARSKIVIIEEGRGGRGAGGPRWDGSLLRRARLMSKEHLLTSHGWWRRVLRPLLFRGKRASGERELPCGARSGDWWKIAGHAAQFGDAHRTLLA